MDKTLTTNPTLVESENAMNIVSQLEPLELVDTPDNGIDAGKPVIRRGVVPLEKTRTCTHMDGDAPVYFPAVPLDIAGKAPSKFQDDFACEHDYFVAFNAWHKHVGVTIPLMHTPVERSWCVHDAEAFFAHMGRRAFHCAAKRESISRAWSDNLDSKGHRKGKLWPQNRMHMAQYVQLTHRDYLPVIVLDIDLAGTSGGSISNLDSGLQARLCDLGSVRLMPNWVGVNPVSGKCQLIWYVDPVSSSQVKKGKNRSLQLYKAVVADLQQFLGADLHFSHGWSRNPLYAGADLTAYRWYPQHHSVFHLRYLSWGLQWIVGEKTLTYENLTVEQARRKQRFSSGRELIDFAISTRKKSEEAQEAAEILENLASSDQALESLFWEADPDVIDGVKMYWLNQDKRIVSRDVTAFRHTMRVAYQLRKAGKELTNAALMQAYLTAYDVAQEVGSGGRVRDPQSVSELEGLARRVRGYVYANKTVQQALNKETTGKFGGMPSSERKALATLGRKGGKKAAERHKNDPKGEYSQGRKRDLAQANKDRILQGMETRSRVLAKYVALAREYGKAPSAAAIGRELGISRKQAAIHVRKLRDAGMLPEV